MANEDHITLGHARMLAEKIDKRVDDVEKTVKQNDEENDSDLNEHTANKSNPHSVTKSQVGLGNVPNVATNDQTPTYTAATTLATLTSGEKLSVSLGKIMKAISDFISHKGNASNPHSVTKSQLGLGDVENKSASTILGEMTKEQVVGALGYTPPETAGNNYTHPSYTAREGVPTADATPAFGGSFNVSQPVSDATGHITGMNSRKITIPNAVATQSAAGLQSAADKKKLDGIAEGANKTTIDSALSASSANPVQNKVVEAAIDQLNTDIASKIQFTLVWQNANPTSTFAAQEISIPSDKAADWYAIISKTVDSNNITFVSSGVACKMIGFDNSAQDRTLTRAVNVNLAGILFNFSVAKTRATYGADSTTVNDKLIPYRIYALNL